MTAFTYTAPESLDEAVALLSEHSEARALAGGLSLLLPINQSKLPAALVDLRKVRELSGVQTRADGSLWIGATTTLTTLSDSADLAPYSALVEAIRLVGDPQVRNRATLGGTLADNHPSSDLAAAVLALGAQIEVAGARGARTIASDAWITGPGQTALGVGELITGITLAAPQKGAGSAYEKFRHPATRYPVAGVAVSVALGGAGAVQSVQIAVTGATSYPVRLRAAEGQAAGGITLTEADVTLDANLSFQSDRFASAAYRAHLTKVLAVRALRRALERASA